MVIGNSFTCTKKSMQTKDTSNWLIDVHVHVGFNQYALIPHLNRFFLCPLDLNRYTK